MTTKPCLTIQTYIDVLDLTLHVLNLTLYNVLDLTLHVLKLTLYNVLDLTLHILKLTLFNLAFTLSLRFSMCQPLCGPG